MDDEIVLMVEGVSGTTMKVNEIQVSLLKLLIVNYFLHTTVKTM